MRGLLLWVMAIGCVVSVGCARRRVVTAAQPPQTIQAQPVSSGGSYPPPQGLVGAQPILVLGQDLYCQFGAVRLQVLANGQLWVDGEFVGTFSGDGGFYNVDGVEIGRLYPNGRMQYAGIMQDAGIDGNLLTSPRGTIAMIDGGGYFQITGSTVPPAPVIGLSQPTVRTFLFAFSMFAALLDTAQRMGH